MAHASDNIQKQLAETKALEAAIYKLSTCHNDIKGDIQKLSTLQNEMNAEIQKLKQAGRDRDTALEDLREEIRDRDQKQDLKQAVEQAVAKSFLRWSMLSEESQDAHSELTEVVRYT